MTQRILDGDLKASDWASAFWFAWAACAVIVGTSIAWIGRHLTRNRTPP